MVRPAQAEERAGAFLWQNNLLRPGRKIGIMEGICEQKEARAVWKERQAVGAGQILLQAGVHPGGAGDFAEHDHHRREYDGHHDAGLFGEVQLSASSPANEFINIFQILCMGMGGGAAVLTAQYWGGRTSTPSSAWSP